MFKSIAISLSPNTEKKDYWAAFRLLFSPQSYLRGEYLKKLETWFRKYFDVNYAVSFDSGRSSEYAILKTLELKKGDEVLIQAFTCVAVPNSILWSGAIPVYVDVDNTYNLDPADLEKKITARSRAIIVTHTFGIPAQINKIKEIARENKLILIEDCAHSLGAKVEEQKIGTFGDVAFFSFGRDKVTSGVFGGMATTNDIQLGQKLQKFQRRLLYPNIFWVMQQLLHPVLFSIILPTYNFFGLGKIILVLGQKLHLLSLPVADLEKSGGRPRSYPRKLPNALAKLAFLQLLRLEEFNKKRKLIAQLYLRELETLGINKLELTGGGAIFLRFPFEINSPEKLFNFAKRKGILLGNWYSNIIDPKGVNFKKIGYRPGSCPNAEEKAKRIINLPTYPQMSLRDAQKVVAVVRKFYDKN